LGIFTLKSVKFVKRVIGTADMVIVQAITKVTRNYLP